MTWLVEEVPPAEVTRPRDTPAHGAGRDPSAVKLNRRQKMIPLPEATSVLRGQLTSHLRRLARSLAIRNPSISHSAGGFLALTLSLCV